jgi:thioredoxin 1
MLSLDKETFETEVLNSEEVVFVDFWSEGCEPCKALLPDIEKLSETYGDKIKFCKMGYYKSKKISYKTKGIRASYSSYIQRRRKSRRGY